MPLIDECGRPLLNLRVALTKRCNLRCQFCHMEGEEKPSQTSSIEMGSAEIICLARIAVQLGMTKIKLTGGEPLMREDVLNIVDGIAKVHGLTDLSMTTNGVLLSSLADGLHASGLKRVNISLPTLNAQLYNKLTGGKLSDVLKGVDAAVQADFDLVKLNMLALKCVPDHDFLQMMDFASKTGATLQIIELEPVNISDSYYVENHKSLEQYESLVQQKAIKVEKRQFMQNRRIYQLPDVRIEVIHPTENTEFCLNCTRLRLTSNGKLKPCLMRKDNLVDVLSPLRNGAADQELTDLFRIANQRREPYTKT